MSDSTPDGLFDQIVNEKELPIDPALTIIFLRALLIVVAGVIFGIQDTSIAIPLVLLSFAVLIFGSWVLSDGSILRTNATLYQSSTNYVIWQLGWFSLVFVGGLSLSAITTPTASYLSLLGDLPIFLESVVNFELATYTENAFLIVLAPVLYKFLQDIDFSGVPLIGRFNESVAFRMSVIAVPIAYAFIRLHGIRSVAFALFAGFMMFSWVYFYGFEDLTKKRALPVLFTFITTYSIHRANNIGSFSALMEYYSNLAAASPPFNFLFWIVFIPDLLFFTVFVIGTVQRTGSIRSRVSEVIR